MSNVLIDLQEMTFKVWSFVSRVFIRWAGLWDIFNFYYGIRKFVDTDLLMGEGFILLTRGYRFMGGVYHPPFDTLKIGTSTDDIKLKLYR